MRTILLLLVVGIVCNCGGAASNNAKPAQNTAPATNTALSTNAAPAAKAPARSPEPIPTVIIPKDGDYTAKGKVMNVWGDAGTIELDHENIPGMMPAMRMIFNVKDKAILKNIKVGDTVEFVLEYKHPTEEVKALKKIE